MKKNIIVSICIAFCLLLSCSNVFARNLKILGNLDDEYVTFYTVVKASQTSIDNFHETGMIYGDFIDVPQNKAGEKNTSYDIMGIIFHKEELSNYGGTGGVSPISEKYNTIDLDGDNSTNADKVEYQYWDWATSDNYNIVYVDEYNQLINLTGDSDSDKAEIQKYLSVSNGQFYKITEKTSIDQSTINDSKGIKNISHEIKNTKGEVIGFAYKVGADIFEVPQYTIYDVNGEKSVVYKYQVKSEIFEKGNILDEKNLFIENSDETERQIYVSFVTKTGETGYMYTADQFYNNIFNKDGLIKDALERQQLAGVDTSEPPDGIVDSGIKKELEDERDEYQGKINDFKLQLDKLSSNDYHGKTELQNEIDKYKGWIVNINTQLDNIQNRLLNLSNALMEYGTSFAPYTKGIDYGGKIGRGWSTANDYDNILILRENNKTFYVNYAEEITPTDLSVLKVAPKIDSQEHQISLNKGTSYLTLSEYNDTVPEEEKILNISKKQEEYEEYKISVGNKNKKIKFWYMTESELNTKLNKNISDEEFQYKYKYKYLRFLVGEQNFTYNTLWDNISKGRRYQSRTREYSI